MPLPRRDQAAAWAPAPSPSQADPIGAQLHALENSLASLRLRLGVMAAVNPQCSHEENFVAVARIAEDAMEETRVLRAALTRPRPRAALARR
jgi:hypothetical protein